MSQFDLSAFRQNLGQGMRTSPTGPTGRSRRPSLDDLSRRVGGLFAGAPSNTGNFPGAPTSGQGGLFPSIGSGPYGIRDQAPGLLGYDLNRQQGAYDAAFAGQQQNLGAAADLFGALAGNLTSIGESGLEEIRTMNQQSLDAFETNRRATMDAAQNRYLGNQASNVAATSGRIAADRNRIMNDPTLSPAQKNAMVQELSFGIGQQGYGAAQQAFGEFQALNTGLQAQFAGQEQQLRGQNTQFIGQAYDRLGNLAATGGQAGAAGLAQVGQLMGAMPQQLVSLFGGLTNLEQFRQGTPWMTQFNGGGRGLTGTISGMPGQTFRGNSWS